MKRWSFVFAVLLVLTSLFPALAQGDPDAAVAWLQTQLRADGGFSDGFSEESNVGATADAVLAATAAGEDVSTWDEAADPLDFLARQAGTASGTGTLAKLMLVAVATGQPPRDFGGADLVAALNETFDEARGLFGETLTEHGYAMLALHAAGEPIPDAATEALLGFQGSDGGWSFDGSSQADTNTTALALQALVVTGEAVDSTPAVAALAFLKGQQNADGGFPYQTPSDFGTESDANSTAWVIQGLLAAEQPLDEWGNPDEFLASLQLDDGAFQWKETVEGANFLATAQAVPALEGVTLVEPPVVEAQEAPTLATDDAETSAESTDEASSEASDASAESDASSESAESDASAESAPDALPTTGQPVERGLPALVTGLLLLLGAGAARRFAHAR